MPWVENKKSPVTNTDIYLESEKFKKICTDLNVHASQNLLEIFEKHGLLYPLYRVNMPKDYLQAIFEQRYTPNRPKNIIEIPDKYVSLWKFQNEELNGWHHPILSGFHRALSEGHPLEQACMREESFIGIPSPDTYKNWNEYKVTLELTRDAETPLRQTTSTVLHFYSPWQIYILEEAYRRHTYTVNVLTSIEENTRFILAKQPQELSLTRWQDHFKILWQYRFREGLLFIKAFEGTKGKILEGDAAEDFRDACKTEASQIGQRYSYESWINFLRELCALYFEYQERERYGLSQCVKQDITFVVDIIMYSFGKNYREIITDVGMRIGGATYFQVSPLEIIYPEYESFLKREATLLLESALDEYNKEVPDNLKLDKSAIVEIINWAFASGNETLLISVIGINKEYFSQSYLGNEGIWSFLRSLAVAIESSVILLEKKENFRNAIETLSGNNFNWCCDQLQRKCRKSNLDVKSYADFKQFLKELSNVSLIKKKNNLTWMKHLIKAYLTRNYVAHHTKLEPELFGSILVGLYNALLFLLFYAWKTKVS